MDTSADASIERFKAFLRIPTITVEGPSGPNHQACAFLKSLADQMGVKSEILEFVPGSPIFLMTIPGKQPSLPSILLNSHYDVVPVMREHWHHDPFAATELPNGDIVARGAQDMKCVCSQYIEALIRLLPQHGGQFERTLHVAFTPDEETGGFNGTGKWIESAQFKALNVGAALDEGLASTTDEYTVFYGERAVWWTRIQATGPTGHGSRFIKNTANEKLVRVINRLLAFREEQEALLEGRRVESSRSGCAHSVAAAAANAHAHGDHAHAHAHSHGQQESALTKPLDLGDVVTVNLTMLKSGVTSNGGASYSINVIPMQAEAGFDIRIPPNFSLDKFEEMLKAWTAEEGVTYDFYQKVEKHSLTSIDERENAYWAAFQRVMREQLKRTVVPRIFPAGTDGRYFREHGIPVFGFSPIARTPILLHDHNERLHRSVFLDGIDVYCALIPALANMTAAP